MTQAEIRVLFQLATNQAWHGGFTAAIEGLRQLADEVPIEHLEVILMLANILENMGKTLPRAGLRSPGLKPSLTVKSAFPFHHLPFPPRSPHNPPNARPPTPTLRKQPMTGWSIHRLSDMVGSKDTQAGLPDGRWVRAVPLPYTGNRMLAAWTVLTGKAYAVQWPKDGDLERALER